MTTLSQALSPEFGRKVQERGDFYHRSGRVKIATSSDSHIEAVVKGSERYLVIIKRDSGTLDVQCTCPYFDTDVCKHVWAVLKVADDRHLLQGSGRNAGLRLTQTYLDKDEPDFDDINAADAVEAEYDADSDANSDESVRPTRSNVMFSHSIQPSRPKKPSSQWRQQLARLAIPHSPVHGNDLWPAHRELIYVLDAASMREGRSALLEVAMRERKKNGDWSKLRIRSIERYWLPQLPGSDDRQILASLIGATSSYGDGYAFSSHYYGGATHPQFHLADIQLSHLLPLIVRCGRTRLRLQPHDDETKWLDLKWDAGEPWQLHTKIHLGSEEHYEVSGFLSRGPDRMPLSVPVALLEDGCVITRTAVAKFQHHGAFNWTLLLRDHSPLRVPVEQSQEFMMRLLEHSAALPLEAPEELRYTMTCITPQCRLTIKPSPNSWEHEKLRGELTFDYEGIIVAGDDIRRGVAQCEQRRFVLRALATEQTARDTLVELGWRTPSARYAEHRNLELQARRLPIVVRTLIVQGWHVEAQGKVYRQSSAFKLAVSSGVDWFDLNGSVQFDKETVALPKLIQAVRRGETSVKLDDGSLGILPEEWLKKYSLFAELGEADGDRLRFKRTQLGLLDLLLEAQPQVSWDQTYAQAREALRTFTGIEPAETPAEFQGELRPYQREGLSWLYFLQKFCFGGCLADDMGLGKTVQVLALLESRRALREKDSSVGPSLVVVPKSLVFNWKQEAARFAPKLRVLEHIGVGRRKSCDHFREYDLLITTYGTLRNDVEEFADIRFDYAILDEAQAIKNNASESAKASRLLRATHRLAMSGTPIENHIGELWSLFEFLNPGMLGAASVFKLAQGSTRNIEADMRQLLARALRPFMLRRTKSEVLRDLPPKLEQTLYCELGGKQRKLYDELRVHYRATLLKRVDAVGLGRAKIQILEALLRLRQAAIHPGLIDKRYLKDTSAKLDALLPQLREVIDEGHKTLVFSQFTGMLSILRAHLGREGIEYEYLDGKTRDREARVARFQTQSSCKLFLISLKAGGTGLNLTAAQYVFLLDPWWNPAVEAQAIDRAHRIGQANQVFAYRLIARDTIEEKVLQLQNAKRELADAILDANTGVIRTMAREDLELLLS